MTNHDTGKVDAKKARIIVGDCLEVLKGFESDSIDSLVTDPPAGIGFMGQEWDHHKGGRAEWVAWMTGVMRECHRVMKPGAHGLVWAIPRTSHWTATALEDAGFEVRDICTHLFGQGFPKSLDISKAIDKAAGAERKVLGIDPTRAGRLKNQVNGFTDPSGWEHGKRNIDITAPATDAAKQWSGWGTALKPAAEFWVLVRKPISEKNVASNVLKHGVGGINIDGCRILSDDKRPDICSRCAKSRDHLSVNSAVKRTGPEGAASSMNIAALNAVALLSGGASTTHFAGSTKTDTSASNIGTTKKKSTSTFLSTDSFGESEFLPDTSSITSMKTSQTTGSKTCSLCGGRITSPITTSVSQSGRFPANLVLSHSPHCTDDQCDIECAIKALDGQSGYLHGRGNKNPSSHKAEEGFLKGRVIRNDGYSRDSGGASRFFFNSRYSEEECSQSSASSVSEISSLDLNLDGFAQKLAAIADLPEEIASSDLLAAFTVAIQSGLKQKSARNIEAILNTGARCLREFRLTSISNNNPVSLAATQRLTDIITTTLSPLTCSGSADRATSGTTPPNLERGAKDSANRFIYCAKISSSERNAGLEDMPDKVKLTQMRGSNGTGKKNFEGGFSDTIAKNTHPTVKPQKLMRYLCKLVTPPGGLVLDPFMGSGSTGLAALSEGFRFIGIEREPEYFEIAEKRIFNHFPEAKKEVQT